MSAQAVGITHEKHSRTTRGVAGEGDRLPGVVEHAVRLEELVQSRAEPGRRNDRVERLRAAILEDRSGRIQTIKRRTDLHQPLLHRFDESDVYDGNASGREGKPFRRREAVSSE